MRAATASKAAIADIDFNTCATSILTEPAGRHARSIDMLLNRAAWVVMSNRFIYLDALRAGKSCSAVMLLTAGTCEVTYC
jgi:hypothetical protein